MAKSDLNPQPRAWPCCSTCNTAYVLRRALVFAVAKSKRSTLASEWIWQRDCKHRTSAAKVARAGAK